MATTTIAPCNGFQHQRQLNLPQRKQKSHQSQSSIRTTTTFTPSIATYTTSQLNAVPGLSSSPLGALAVLAGIVVIHESGHYLAARTFNISVEEFSIGFGPKLLGFEKFGNEFNLRALPLGGYVRFPENFDSELLQENDQFKREARSKIRKFEADQNIQKEWNWKEELLNALTLGYLTERNYDTERKQRGIKRKENEEAKLVQLRSTPWWKRPFVKFTAPRLEAMNDNGNNNIDKIYEELDSLEKFEVEYSDNPRLLQNRPWPERAVVLSGGVIFNILLAFSIYFCQIGQFGGQASAANAGGLPRAVYDNGVIVAKVNQGPSDGLLRKGDIITSINGQSVQIGSRRTSVAAGQKQVSDVISTIRNTPDNESITVQFLRAEAGIARDSTSAASTNLQQNQEVSSEVAAMTVISKSVSTTETISIQPQRSDGTTQTIGVMLSPNLEKVERLKSDNPIVAFKLAWEYLSDIFTLTLSGTVSALSSFISPSGPAPGQKISGPIGLIQQGSTVVATKDWTTIWLFAAGLSVNLGVINALPIPALDGGQLVFVIAEAITGKKVDQKFQENVTTIAVLFLLYLSLSAAVGDVGSLITGLR